MTTSGEQDLSSFSMLDLFRQETDTQSALLNENLLALEKDPADAERLATLMRAAHSLKGAARIVNLDAAVKIAHAMEDCFVAAQKGEIIMRPESVDGLLSGVDMLVQISRVPEESYTEWQNEHQLSLDELTGLLAVIRSNSLPAKAAQPEPAPTHPPGTVPLPEHQPKDLFAGTVRAAFSEERMTNRTNRPGEPREWHIRGTHPTPSNPVAAAQTPIDPGPSSPTSTEAAQSARLGTIAQSGPESGDRNVRVSSDNLNRMLGMMGEYMVQTRWLEPFASALQAIKHKQAVLARLMEEAFDAQDDWRKSERVAALRRQLDACRQLMAKRIEEFEFFARQSSDLAERLYREGLVSRMRPFADGTQGFPRMVRDLARRLDKKVRFEIIGQTTGVDREILDKLEAPLTHLLRNALDHGLETPEERQAVGKNPEGSLTLEARHQAGLLHIIVADNGRGIDLERIRRKVIDLGLSTDEVVSHLTEAELLDFLFLPGFSTTGAVTEISGRGVGLDIVRSLTQEVGGLVRVENRPDAGTRFHLQLPITLSVLRTLLVEIASEPFAIPLTRIEHLVFATPDEIKTMEGRRYLTLDNRHVGLVPARDVLELPGSADLSAGWPVVIIGSASGSYGLVVDRFIGESKLVVRALDPRLGKVQDVSAAALLDDGAPVLILDTEDMVRSIENLLSGGRLKQFQTADTRARAKARKHILLAEDSVTVREMERKLLENGGYSVDVAVDGMDAWNAARAGNYDLLISDVDMPRMSGIELVKHIRQDSKLSELPVLIVSYKDRAEDHQAGLEAGATRYLPKSSFHDKTFLDAVADVMGDQ